MSSYLEALRTACRPVLVYGAGMRHADALALKFAQLLGVPILTTWAARDMMPESEPLNVGGFGTHALRHANFAIQNADWILSVGSRLDTKATGPLESFAPHARLWMVDVDAAEIAKFGRVTGIIQDAQEFLAAALEEAYAAPAMPSFLDWRRRIDGWKAKYAPAIHKTGPGVDPYFVIKTLSRLTIDETICADIGTVLVYAAQAFEFTRQRMIYAWNQGPMGYGLPSAIAAALATGRKVVYLAGDASMHMAMGEMATLAKLHLPVKTLIFNNRGHGLVRQTQRQWFGGDYQSTSVAGGLPDANYVAIAQAYGFRAERCERNDDLEHFMAKLLVHDDPAFLELVIPHEAESRPLCRFNAPLHDAEPLLPREVLAEIMATSA